MLWNFFTLIKEIRWEDFLDIIIASLLLWIVIQGLRSARARAAGLGFLLLGAIYLGARLFDLKLTIWILQGVAAIFFLVVVVVFQDEIRRIFERFPSFLPRTSRGETAPQRVAGILTESISQLAAEQTGALIVLPGHDPLEGVSTGGIALGGRLSKPLLLSLFDSSSPGHDGAIIIEGDVVRRFAAHLPLSTDVEQLRERGTRHAAALGLAEKCDALVLVVSEETGRISVAHRGSLQKVSNPGEEGRIITQFLEEHAVPSARPAIVSALLKRGGLEGLLALLVSIGLWLLLVPGSVVMETSYQVPVVIENIPTGFALDQFSPSEIEVTLSGARRQLYLLDTKKLNIRIDATLARFGRQTFSVDPAHLLIPPEINVATLEPSQVKVFVKKVE